LFHNSIQVLNQSVVIPKQKRLSFWIETNIPNENTDAFNKRGVRLQISLVSGGRHSMRKQ
jgi:hypothetical protein